MCCAGVVILKRPSENRFRLMQPAFSDGLFLTTYLSPRDYHRVKVTGLNSAVWPDPPGYRAQRPDTQTEEKPRRAPRPARRMNRKTEGGTGNAE